MLYHARKWRLLRVPALMFIILTLTWACDSGDTKVVYRDATVVEIGAVVALSDASPIWGRSCLEALRLAETDVNNNLNESGSEKRVRLVYGDSGTEPEVADSLLRSFLSQDIRAVVGPLTSSELLTMEATINESDAVLISPSSTVASLGLPGDNILRMVPSDGLMVDAITQALLYKGVESLVVLYVDDEWGQAILDGLTASFEARGGTILGSLGYINVRPDMLQTQLDDLSRMISDRMAVADPSTIGFMLICYDEGYGIMEMASADAALGQVGWFGTDGFVGYRSLSTDEAVGAFAARVEYTAPSLEIPLTAEGEALKDKIETATGLPATIYSLLAYDAFRVAANALLGSPDGVSATDLREKLYSEFAAYEGATSPINLNEAGDRADGIYYFYAVEDVDGSYEWRHALTYENGAVTPN